MQFEKTNKIGRAEKKGRELKQPKMVAKKGAGSISEEMSGGSQQVQKRSRQSLVQTGEKLSKQSKMVTRKKGHKLNLRRRVAAKLEKLELRENLRLKQNIFVSREDIEM